MRIVPFKIAGFIFFLSLSFGLLLFLPNVSAQDNVIKKRGGGNVDLSSAGLEPAPNGLQKFDFEVKDTGALELARKVYAGYTKSIGMQPNFEDPDFARYIPLMPGQNKRFLGYYRWDRIRNGCPPLGCLTHIFENFNGNKWRLVMNVFVHDFWIDPRSGRGNAPRDVYLFSSYGSAASPDFSSDPNMQEVGAFETLGRWSWDSETDKYVSNGVFYMTDYPYKEE